MIKASLLGFAAAFLLAAAGQGIAAPNSPSTDMPAATPTPTAPQDQPKPMQTAKNTHDSNQVVCKTEDTTGTRLGGHRTCMTRAAWEQQAQNAKDTTNSTQYGHQWNPSGH